MLEALAAPGWVSHDATVVVEQAAGSPLPPVPHGWEARWERAYGDTLVRILGP